MINAIEKYNITADNIYNVDEKSFLIGQASASKCVITQTAFESSWILGAKQDSSQEFISLIACICANQTVISPCLIYKGEFHDLIDSWIKDLYEKDLAYFAASDLGWSCNALELQ